MLWHPRPQVSQKTPTPASLMPLTVNATGIPRTSEMASCCGRPASHSGIWISGKHPLSLEPEPRPINTLT